MGKVCVHGHFYQPPRENPWLEAIEAQESAAPYHDWNERIAEECYAPNAAARILDDQGATRERFDNYAHMSFDFGPTLLTWLRAKRPDIHGAVLAADRGSAARFSGHGSAMAQAYHHVVMPLASERDKRTQALWGLRDFEHRFGRAPEGMWLPETAVDLASLEAMAALGIRFTVLAPYQARRVRRIGESAWRDNAGDLDTTVPYRVALPSGHSLAVFFYDGTISHAVAFEHLLDDGERLAGRLLEAAGNDDRPRLVHLATDGETYGHHHAHGDMALAYALDRIAGGGGNGGGGALTNYGELLAHHPPEHEAEIHENTSWSCAHGIERWRADCGCNSGTHPDWNQAWRAPLRAALEGLRDALAEVYEEAGGALLDEPWAARDDYVEVLLDRSRDNVERFLARHMHGPAGAADTVRALQLLEMQRHAMQMFTSCGWFFDDLGGIETVQVMQYAGRAARLGEAVSGRSLEGPFLAALEAASSNVPEAGNGRQVYERRVLPAVADLPRVAAHLAIRSLLGGAGHGDDATVYCFDVTQRRQRDLAAGGARMLVGGACFASRSTWEGAELVFAAVRHHGGEVACRVRPYDDEHGYRELVDELTAAFEGDGPTAALAVVERRFEGPTHGPESLLGDERAAILERLAAATPAAG